MPTGIYPRTNKHKYWLGKKRPEIKKYFTMKGKYHTNTTKKKISTSHLGIKPSKASRIKMSLAKLGKTGNRKGTHCSEETKIILSQYRGPLNSQWKGGITPLVKYLRNIREYKIWRINVFKRDGYTCVKCGNKRKIIAHHKKEFNIIFQEFLQTYSQFSPIEDWETLVRLAMTYEPFWDVNNGETECEDCHNKERINEKC
jgi:hypothetical protein